MTEKQLFLLCRDYIVAIAITLDCALL